jgi:hypothetical protein
MWPAASPGSPARDHAARCGVLGRVLSLGYERSLRPCIAWCSRPGKRGTLPPTFADVDELVGPATPHFAYQLRARVLELVLDLPQEHPVRQYADEKMELLDRLGHASSKAADSRREPQSRPGWSELPSSAPADEPLPRR